MSWRNKISFAVVTSCKTQWMSSSVNTHEVSPLTFHICILLCSKCLTRFVDKSTTPWREHDVVRHYPPQEHIKVPNNKKNSCVLKTKKLKQLKHERCSNSIDTALNKWTTHQDFTLQFSTTSTRSSRAGGRQNVLPTSTTGPRPCLMLIERPCRLKHL